MNIGVALFPLRDTMPAIELPEGVIALPARYEVCSPVVGTLPAPTRKAAMVLVAAAARALPGHWVSLWRHRDDGVTHYRARRCKACAGVGQMDLAFPDGTGEIEKRPCSCPRCHGTGKRVARAGKDML
jgi:hypothetical protein